MQTSPKLKARNCAHCRVRFDQVRLGQQLCGIHCTLAWVDAKRAKKAAKAASDDKRKTRAQLEAIKTIPQLKKEAQIEFNKFIRARDRAGGVACICCDRHLEFERVGGAVDAGHYRSTGSADHLRFNEDNCHAQRSDCNRYGAGRAVDYRIGLIRRIGRERVEAIEAMNTTHKWDRDHLRAIKALYRAKWQQLEKR